jgi:hypothetical protein
VTASTAVRAGRAAGTREAFMLGRYTGVVLRRSTLPFGLAVLVSLAAAATPLAGGTARSVLVEQAMHTLGATPVACADIAAGFANAPGEIRCARVPGSMFGFFREAVHGRLFEYLQRGTLLVLHPWSSEGDRLRVDYVIDRGVLGIERIRAHGKVWAVFRFRAVPPPAVQRGGREPGGPAASDGP